MPLNHSILNLYFIVYTIICVYEPSYNTIYTYSEFCFVSNRTKRFNFAYCKRRHWRCPLAKPRSNRPVCVWPKCLGRRGEARVFCDDRFCAHNGVILADKNSVWWGKHFAEYGYLYRWGVHSLFLFLSFLSRPELDCPVRWANYPSAKCVCFVVLLQFPFNLILNGWRSVYMRVCSSMKMVSLFRNNVGWLSFYLILYV